MHAASEAAAPAPPAAEPQRVHADASLGRARLSFADAAEIEEFVRVLERFERGELDPDQWRAFRLVRGTYGQRQAGDVQMLRIKIPQGVLNRAQLEALADVGERFSRGFGHVTTRQNVQFHFLTLRGVEGALRRLAEAGLTSREACGSAVRNVTACPYAGVAGDELFDVTPYAEALTRHLLRHPLASTLPRKFKIAFEGCRSGDHALTAINDLGFRAQVRTLAGRQQRGFRVTAGGGTSILPTSGAVLFDFLPAQDLLEAAEAVLRVFARLGDYQHKSRNRMKFLIRSLGFEAWRGQVEEELGALRADGRRALPFDPEAPPEESAPGWPRPQPPALDELVHRAQAAHLSGPGLRPVTLCELPLLDDERRRWSRTNVRPQKQPGYATVTLTLPLGDLTCAQMRLVGQLAESYADGTVRTTTRQDLLLRWVPQDDLAALYRCLRAAGLGRAGADTLADVTSCPGAEACRLAVTQSRGLGRLLSEHLSARLEKLEAAAGLDLRISGCPNGCGLHHVAGLGFQGSVRQVGGKAAPQYFVLVGGGVDPEGARFGRLAAKIPVRRMTAAVDRLLDLYLAARAPGESAPAFFRRVDVDRVKAVLADLEVLEAQAVGSEDFVDLGEAQGFKVEAMAGECSA